MRILICLLSLMVLCSPVFSIEEVELIESGSAPLKKIRMALDQGSQNLGELSWSGVRTVEVKTFVDPKAADRPDAEEKLHQVKTLRYPATKLLMKSTVTGYRPARADYETSGTMISTQFLNVEVAPDFVPETPEDQQFLREIETILLLSPFRTVDNRGRALEESFISSDDLERMGIRWLEMLTSFRLKLPQEPIGVGAKWRTWHSFFAGPIEVKNEVIHTLTSINGNLLTIDHEIETELKDQKFQSLQVQDGSDAPGLIRTLKVKARVKGLHSTHEPAPRRLDGTSSLMMDLRQQVEAMIADVTANVEYQIKLTPVEPEEQ